MNRTLVLTKEHSNGNVSEVLLQANGRFAARERPVSGGREAFETSQIVDLDRAMAEADRHAHPEGCDWRCRAWGSVPVDRERK
jgi:hypothetical protein